MIRYLPGAGTKSSQIYSNKKIGEKIEMTDSSVLQEVGQVRSIVMYFTGDKVVISLFQNRGIMGNEKYKWTRRPHRNYPFRI